MMKRAISILAVCLMLTAALFTLSACGGKSDAQKLVGTWTATSDAADAITAQLAGEGIDAAVKSFPISLTMTFTAEGTYQLETTVTDEARESITETLNNVVDAVLQDALKAQGADMSTEELLGALGYSSMDQLISEILGGNVDEVFAEFNSTSFGSFKAENGKLYISDGESDLDETEYNAYELTDTTLTLTGEGLSEEDMMGLYPAVFTRVS